MTRRRLLSEAKLWLVAIPVLLWTLVPIYHIFLFSISTKESAFSGRLWPEHPTLRNFYQIERLWSDAQPVPLQKIR